MSQHLQQIGTLCVAFLLGSSIALALFFVMVFLIKPQRTRNINIPRLYVVSYIAENHKKKTKPTRSKEIDRPKITSHRKPIPARDRGTQKITRKRIHVPLPVPSQINIFARGQARALGFNYEADRIYHSDDDQKLRFDGIEKKYVRPSKEKPEPPERLRITGGGEIDRIGNTCYEVPGAGAFGAAALGMTATEKNENSAMHSLMARQVSCNKRNSSLARDFLKQLKKRGLILAPVPTTH